MNDNQKYPVRTAVGKGIDAGVLVFFGALALNLINRALGETVAKTKPETPQEPQPQDFHAVVD